MNTLGDWYLNVHIVRGLELMRVNEMRVAGSRGWCGHGVSNINTRPCNAHESWTPSVSHHCCSVSYSSLVNEMPWPLVIPIVTLANPMPCLIKTKIETKSWSTGHTAFLGKGSG